MRTDTAENFHNHARNFALQGVAWSVGLFALVRLNWLENHLVLPLTYAQARFAVSTFGAPVLPIDVTLACSGADAFALCAAAILAYPATWRKRLTGALGGVALILLLNTVRIGTLGRAAASPSLFYALHVYAWPGLLMLAIAGYVFTWMRLADKPRVVVDDATPDLFSTFVTRRFMWLTAGLLVLFTAASPLYLESAGVLAVAGFIARAAAFVLRLLGVEAHSTANVLSTARGGFLVTQECISTPLIPVYLAAVLSFASHWRFRALAILAAGPLFVALGITRLLVVALPAALIGSPLLLIHAFYQLLLAAVVVVIAALWRHGPHSAAWRRALLGVALGGLLVYLLGSSYTRALTSAFGGGPHLEDPQGAIALLPAFQIGLYVALFLAAFVVLRWRSFAAGVAVLGLSQMAVLAAFHFMIRYGLTPHVRDVRAWALAGPVLLIAAMVKYERPPH